MTGDNGLWRRAAHVGPCLSWSHTLDTQTRSSLFSWSIVLLFWVCVWVSTSHMGRCSGNNISRQTPKKWGSDRVYFLKRHWWDGGWMWWGLTWKIGTVWAQSNKWQIIAVCLRISPTKASSTKRDLQLLLTWFSRLLKAVCPFHQHAEDLAPFLPFGWLGSHNPLQLPLASMI